MMVPQMPRLALAVALLLVAAIPARAQQPEWIRLGEQTLGVAGEVIPVGRQEGMFQRLKLESVRGTAFVRSLRITYVGGRSGEVPVGQSVGPGRGTDPILLPGGRGVAIEQIEIVARGEPGQGDGAVLRVLGEQADDQAPPVAPRVAEARGLSLEAVRDLIETHTEAPIAGILGEARVNVLQLNLALDDLSQS